MQKGRGNLEDNEAWIQPIKAISVKMDKPGVPRLEEVYDSGNEPSDEEELRHTKLRLGYGTMPQGRSNKPPPPPPSHKKPPPSPTPELEDQVHEFTTRFDAFWDKTQEH